MGLKENDAIFWVQEVICIKQKTQWLPNFEAFAKKNAKSALAEGFESLQKCFLYFLTPTKAS